MTSFVARALPAIVCACLAGCTAPRDREAEIAFVVAAGDSSFLVEASGADLVVARTPMLLARLGGGLHELYVVDRDFSFHDAIFVGQAVYRRDLVTGDSTLVWEDRRIREVALAWRRAHPDAVPLGPDEDGAEDPATQAVSETELLDVVGPYLNYEYHLDVDAAGEPHEHTTRRGVLDIRDGHHVTLAEVVDSAAVRQVIAAARRTFQEAVDSVRRATDARAAQARAVVDAFRFDSTSFELVEVDRTLVAAFFAPGAGEHAGSYALPHGEVPLERPAWLEELADTRPTAFEQTRLEWRDPRYNVVATIADRDGAAATLEVVRGRERRSIGEVPTPVSRLYRLGDNTKQRRAVRQAFAQWAVGLAAPATSRSRSRTTPLPRPS